MRDSRPHVLVVDDEPLMLELIRRILARSAVTVTAVETGAAACATLAHPPHPDLVMADLSIPVIDGLAVARVCGAICPPVPVILLTGHTVTGELPPNVCTVLRKPFRPAELLDKAAEV